MTAAVLGHQAELRPLKRNEYERLIDAGAFVDERVELIEGFLVRTTPQRPAHSSAVQQLTRLLFSHLGADDRFDIRVQLPLVVGDDSEPEPNLAVVPAGSYGIEHPTTAHLVIEVAQTSLAIDRTKARVYARAEVPTYWIVDVERHLVEVRTEPGPDGYAQLATFSGDDALSPTNLSGLELSVGSVFMGR